MRCMYGSSWRSPSLHCPLSTRAMSSCIARGLCWLTFTFTQHVSTRIVKATMPLSICCLQNGKRGITSGLGSACAAWEAPVRNFHVAPLRRKTGFVIGYELHEYGISSCGISGNGDTATAMYSHVVPRGDVLQAVAVADGA